MSTLIHQNSHSIVVTEVLLPCLLINSLHAEFPCPNVMASQSRLSVLWVPEFSETIPHSASTYNLLSSPQKHCYNICLRKNIERWERRLLTISLCTFWNLFYPYNLWLSTFVLITKLYPQYFHNSIFILIINLHIWMMRYCYMISIFPCMPLHTLCFLFVQNIHRRF